MAIELNCPECGSVLRVAAENLDKQSRCPSCLHVFIAKYESSLQDDSRSTSGQEPALLMGGRERASADSIEMIDQGQGAIDPLVEKEVLDRGWKALSEGGVAEFELNPYSPVASVAVESDDSGELSPTEITIDSVLSTSWAIFRKHWAMACIAIIIVSGVNYGISFLQNLLLMGLEGGAPINEAVTIGLQFLVFAIVWVSGLWLQLGQSLLMLDICRGKPVEFSRIFAAGSCLIPGVGAMLIVIFVLGVLAAVFVGIPVGIAFQLSGDLDVLLPVGLAGAAIGAIPFVILSISFSVSQLLVADRRCGPWDAVVTSMRVTRGNKLVLLLIGLVVSAISVVAFLVGLLAFCLGVIPAMIAVGAFASLVLTVAYLLMTGQAIAIPEYNTVRN
ncbi:hypothetical protein N9D38_00615 [Rubripirellula sp.]|nr:hypothetical protein [Rubripirellula sp.]